MTCRRRVARAALLETAGQSPIPCVVLDLGGHGARLGVHRQLDVPDEFRLSVDREGLVVLCRVAWRRGNQTGVMFTDVLATSSDFTI